MTRIMIVDDDQTTVSLLKTLLELDDYDVSIVHRGHDVLDRLPQDEPQLIMMDYHLADCEGVEIVRAIRAHENETYRNLPIIVSSGLDVTDEAMDAGANQFIVKPFEPSDLPRIFEELLAGQS